MAKYPMLDLHYLVKDCKIYLSVGEASNSNCSGTLTVIITGVNSGNTAIIKRDLTNIGYPPLEVLLDETPRTGKIHPVIATLVLDSGETKVDDELIQLCE